MNLENKISTKVENKQKIDLKISEFLNNFPEQIRDNNIIPIFDKNLKGFAPKNPGYSWKKYQNEKYPVKDLMRKKINNYGVICGDSLNKGIYLTVIDLDNKLFLDYFKDEETLIIKTPNGGYHIYYYTPIQVVKKKRFLKLPIDVQGVGSYVIIPPSCYEAGYYEVIKNQTIKTIDNLMDYVVDKLPNSLKIIEQVENSQPSNIKQFKKILHENVSLLDIIKDHFPTNWYEPQEIREHGNVIRLFNPIKKQESSSPSFVIFDETQTWYSHSNDESGDVIEFIKIIKKESSLDHALQYLQKKYGIKAPTMKPKKGDDETVIDSFDDFLDKLKENSKVITHGMSYNDELGLLYASLYPGDVNGIYGISRNKPIRAVHKADAKNKELTDDIFLCEGYRHQLNARTLKGISNLLHQLHSKGKFEYKPISDIFDSILKTTQEDYLELENKKEYYFLILWIIGTYLRALFVWYPYITFYGLRDVGKSTSLTLLSNLCFNGSGEISGSTSEASLFRKASSTKGFFTMDHYEEVRKSREKRQIITQYLESAWYLNSTIDKVNKETMELEIFRVASSVALGTREVDPVLEEKGIVIEMVESSDKNKRRNSGRMHKDPFFKDIQEKCMATALIYQDKIIEAYENIEDIEGLEGRDTNKFLPFIALAKVIDDDNNSKYRLYDNIVEFAVEYRKHRKEDLKDYEELLLKIILDENIEFTTYPELAEKMERDGVQYYGWQSAKSDLRKLQIIKRTHPDKRPIEIEIDLERAVKRAESRGIKIESGNSNMEIKNEANYSEIIEINYEDIPALKTDSITDMEFSESYGILTENGSLKINSFVDKLGLRTNNDNDRCWGVYMCLKDSGLIKSKSKGWIMASDELGQKLGGVV